MGDAPSNQIDLSRGAGDSTTSAPKPNGASAEAPGSTMANHPPNSTGTSHGRIEAPSPLNMSNMVYSLPAHQPQPVPFDPQHMVHPYPPPNHHTQGVVYPVQPMGDFPGPAPGGGVAYGIPYAPAYPSYPLPQHLGAVQHAGGHYPPFGTVPSMPGMAPGQTTVYGAGYYHPAYTASYGPGPHPFGQGRQPNPMRGQGPRAGPATTPSPPKKEAGKRAANAEYDVSKTIVDGSNPSKLAQAPLSIPASDAPSHSVPTSSTPRGPPRKPKQSGHALWVGNLPPGANVVDLKDHFSQDATDDIESVFLISKSNCAFVNYRSSATCAAALARFHDSRFQGVRLVCRLRKGVSVPGAGPRVGSETPLDDESPPVVPQPHAAAPLRDEPRSLDRYFVVKSLTVEDLELSEKSGIWATQTHNETHLNHAFETTDHVYLVFSANKSGEYFGYARMLSPISDDEELALEMPARPEPLAAEPEELDVTVTAATASAPKGRIIDDSARGTIFWEVESSEEDDVRSERSMEGPDEVEVEAEGQSFGKPFRIQWLSTSRVPFHRTRGLRNPWNANREVKIARDGTEIEPTVGRKLVQLFHL